MLEATFRMTFEVNNFAIRTWNVVLVSECRFVSASVVFFSEICASVVKERSVLEIYSLTVGTPLNSVILRLASTKPFLCQKAVCNSESALYFEIGGRCVPP